MAGETRVPERLPVQPPHDDRGPPGLTQGLAALLQRPASTGGRQTSGRQSALADPLAQAENGSGDRPGFVLWSALVCLQAFKSCQHCKKQLYNLYRSKFIYPKRIICILRLCQPTYFHSKKDGFRADPFFLKSLSLEKSKVANPSSGLQFYFILYIQ